MGQGSELPRAAQDCHELLLWIIPLLDQFPRNRRFTLGERLETSLLQVLEGVTEAAYSRGSRKASVLRQSNLKLQVARHLWRLSQELKVISLRRYRHGAGLMEALGKQIGGWQRSVVDQ